MLVNRIIGSGCPPQGKIPVLSTGLVKKHLILYNIVPLWWCSGKACFLTIVSVKREVILSPDTAVAPVLDQESEK